MINSAQNDHKLSEEVFNCLFIDWTTQLISDRGNISERFWLNFDQEFNLNPSRSRRNSLNADNSESSHGGSRRSTLTSELAPQNLNTTRLLAENDDLASQNSEFSNRSEKFRQFLKCASVKSDSSKNTFSTRMTDTNSADQDQQQQRLEVQYLRQKLKGYFFLILPEVCALSRPAQYLNFLL